MAIIDDAVATYRETHTIKGAALPLAWIEKNEAAKKLGISVKALESYLPYSRMPYNQPTRSPNAEKLARWRATGSTLPNTGNED